MSHTHRPRLAQPRRSPQGGRGEPGRQGLPNAPQFLSPHFPRLPLCKPTAAGACPSQQGHSKSPGGGGLTSWDRSMGGPAPQRPDLLGPSGSGTGFPGGGLCTGRRGSQER